MVAYYNEVDRDAAHVLRCLIADGLIAPGDVDDRSIVDVQPSDLAGYGQCHFFAGAGLWSVAARIAGWPDDRPLWTGSCPCQPFSAAGRGLGTDDPRHLWPHFFRLIRAGRPPVVMGEQVAGAPGYGWFDGVRSDLAGEGFASRVVDIPACAVDAPHIRQRLYWLAVADSSSSGRVPAPHAGIHRQAQGERPRHGESERLPSPRNLVHSESVGRREGRTESELRGGRPAAAVTDAPSDVANANRTAFERGRRELPDPQGPQAGRDGDGHWRDDAVAVADANQPLRRLGNEQPTRQQPEHEPNARDDVRPRARNGSAWAGADWLVCHDGKARRTEPGLRLLVDGMAGRVPAWRLAGNSISPVLAAEVISAFLDVEGV